MADLLLITPPFTQLNTPYPATAYLKGFLNTKQISSFQMDLGIEVILKLFSKEGLADLFTYADEMESIQSENAERILALQETYIKVVDSVITFLQGKRPSLARQICNGQFLPQAKRFEQLDDMEWAFGNMGLQDKAKHLATLFLEDISDFIIECVDPHFGFSRYAERLGRSANSFDELHEELLAEPSYVDIISLEILEQRIQEIQPKLLCFSVPFPGNLYSAFRCAQYSKLHYPSIKIAMGGGFPNTELRSLTDTRVFDYFDFITLDDGELPIELLVEKVLGKNKEPEYKRTFLREGDKVVYQNNSKRSDYKQQDVGTPDYADLLLEDYISVIEVANSMHSLWSDGRWNKLTMAHGCYWGKCTFCDISLDYIKLYEPLAARTIVDRMEELIAQTGETGFHFVDEAAPPALMREVALEIIRRELVVSWWTNIRFEKSFTPDLCQLLVASGCIAVSGGLEVASNRLLALIQKGVTVEQVARVTHNFTEAGIMVHAYLMYAYPTQTVQETIDSLEMVRQLFELGVIQSGFWHQFALTVHSPVGMDPDAYGIIPVHEHISFAHNDVQFKDSTGIDHDVFSFGLRKSLFNYMHGLGFDTPLKEWFDFEVPDSSVPRDLIMQALASQKPTTPKASSKLVWLGASPLAYPSGDELQLSFFSKHASFDLVLDEALGNWLARILSKSAISQGISMMTWGKWKADFEQYFNDFEGFWESEVIEVLREHGLLIL